MNKKFLLPTLGIIMMSLSFFACKRTTEDKYKNDPSMGYYPITIGKYVVYNVDSTIWDDFNCVKITHSYQMRYTIADTFTDDQKRKSYRIEVLIRSNDTAAWKTTAVNYITRTTSGIEGVEGTLRFLKIIFPVVEGTTWKGNAMIATNDQDLQYFSDWTYKYLNVAKAYQIGDSNYTNTVTVTETDEHQNDPEQMPTAYAYKTFATEVYGYNIGLVYKELTHWIYDPGVKNCRKGYSVMMRAIGHN